MKSKIFKNLDEQIDILKSRGLIISDEDNAKQILFRENYFFINGYRHMFTTTDKDKFISGTTFEELYATFVFDRRIRNIVFKYILIIENNIKSIMSYQLSRKYGFKDKDYLNPDNFTQDSAKSRQVFDILNKMKRQIRVNGRQHSATLHYLSNYGYIPMWILVKVLSFGIISELFCILKYEDQNEIAKLYNTDVETLSIYLSLLANFRNLCAHEDILYDHRTNREIPNNEYHSILNISKNDEGEYAYGKNDLYAIILIMKKMLSDGEFRDIIFEIGYEIDILDSKVDIVPLNSILNKIGFPNNWREIVDL
ncbi:MAG: Abi family protein [Bacilli bacterium]|nr:Abi family protein [Bacilli bacterium]MCI8778318.1 Abi family protein [Bacilli bacterium]